MFGSKKRFSDMGAVKRDTNQIIDETIEKQQEIKRSWSTRRPSTLAVAAPKSGKAAAPSTEPIAVLPSKPSSIFNDDGKGGIMKYWFPILCAAAVLSVAIWTFWPASKPADKPAAKPQVEIVETSAPAELKPIDEKADAARAADAPTFDIVRVESNGNVVIAGRGKANENISVKINKKIVATIAADKNGEFAYTPKNKLKPGNYVVQLLAGNAASDKVFLYIDAKADQSMSLLMTAKSSKVLQKPAKLADGALVVSKIDYLENGRIVVQGKGLPRLRASLSLNGKTLGMTRVSDHKNFGLGAGVEPLKAGENYEIAVKLHDAENNIVSEITHKFVMPAMTAGDETFYVVRRDDCLWVIAKNFLGRGIRFSIIANANNIKDPNKIYPNQKFKIPVK
ncbi:MAG: LysM peptidoglycan-binding domain-containing protein [Rickettsiales bacterium]|jgi:nucleoid-associated protein YgaU|nr:LysM peptidoglycan-binding domain-containing protein [Rickettsiales bacterium]